VGGDDQWRVANVKRRQRRHIASVPLSLQSGELHVPEILGWTPVKRILGWTPVKRILGWTPIERMRP
jgi:hypothetical protein